MRTFQEYIGWLRKLQPELDSPELEERIKLMRKKDVQSFYRATSGLPLHPGDSNLMLGINLNLETTIDELGKFGMGINGDEPTRTDWASWWEDNKKVTAYDWRPTTSIKGGGLIWSDPSEVSFAYSEPQVIATPLGLKVDKPIVQIKNRLFSRLGRVDENLPVQTLITTHLVGERREIEDFMLNILGYLVREKIPAFYGQYKSPDDYVINK